MCIFLADLQEILEKSEFSPNLKMLSFFCFSKLGAPLFRFFLSRPETSISGENPCFPISGGHVHPPTTKIIIFTKIIFFDYFGENWCFSGGWVYITSRDRKTWIFTGNGRFRTRQKKLKSGAPNFEKQKNESILQNGKKIDFFPVSETPTRASFKGLAHAMLQRWRQNPGKLS